MGQIYFLKGNLTNKIDMSNGHVWKTELLGEIQGVTRKLELTVSPLFHLKHPRAVVLTSPHEPPPTQRERGLDRGSDEAGQLMEGVNHSTPVQRNSCPLFHFPLLKVALQVTKPMSLMAFCWSWSLPLYKGASTLHHIGACPWEDFWSLKLIHLISVRP